MKSRWYKDAVFYQIYPRSFCDSNGDGIGDIRGIISKLDYLKDLGINAVWLSPVYASPNDDNGYDISDYRNIMPEFGTMEDWKEMIDEMHKRGIRLVMDLVVNHTSDEHAWFQESRKSKDNPYRDYYIWRKGRGKDGKKPPNNWTSRFQGSAWEYDEATGEWYLHLFSKKQPDLNWDNPKVRQEVIDICNFWFELGVDGFRCDVITYISKAEGLPNGKFNPFLCGDEHFILGPHIHEYLNQVNRESWSKYDTMIVGEAIGCTVDNAESLVSEDRNELDSAITFELMQVDFKWDFWPVKFNLKKFKAVQSAFQSLPDTCWNTLYYENHDQPRSVSRYGNGNGYHRKELAKMLAVSLHMLKGTPYVYQGQEIGMTNIALEEKEYVDIMATRVFEMVRKIFPPLMPIARWAMAKRARDHARTPMQWNGKQGAGFTTGKPWMKINPNHSDVNVESDLKNPNSVLNFYKQLIAFRLHNDVIIHGTYKEYFHNNKNVYCYERAYRGKRYIVICNFKEKNVPLNVDTIGAKGAKLVLANYPKAAETMGDAVFLRPYEAVVYEIGGQTEA
ncbi:MAG TPA: alpha-glucosidase [Candidatus Stercoripulliclostridium merdipullorum]|uniref:Alpha-glucosidase n=1 Tax=Candidatus Stercoripulliclostridium merdipullorum TaxID=2840952 RepID=A0A9D1NCG8_9FIRM|nr:alpha-glucosidase [Candidatus Stercoripulliclostridium merdipullorum]